MPDFSIINSTAPILQESLVKAREQDSDHQKLRKATRQMESYFVGVLLKKMNDTQAKGGLFDQRPESATYREMFYDAVANEIGKQGAFGIADVLYKQLVVNLNVPIEEKK